MWVKGKTIEAKCPPQEADSPANSGGPNFLTITGELHLHCTGKKHCEDKVLHFTFSSEVNNSTALFIIIFQLWERDEEVGNSRNFPE